MRHGAIRGRGRASAPHILCIVLAVASVVLTASWAFAANTTTHGLLPRGVDGGRWVPSPGAFAPAGPAVSAGRPGFGLGGQIWGIGSALLAIAAVSRPLTRRQVSTRRSNVRLFATSAPAMCPPSQGLPGLKQHDVIPTACLLTTTLASDACVSAAEAAAPATRGAVLPSVPLADATTVAAGSEVAGSGMPNSKQRARFVGSTRCPGSRRSHSRRASARSTMFASKADRRRIGGHLSVQPRQCARPQVQSYDPSRVRAKIQSGLRVQSSASMAHGRESVTPASSTSEASAVGLSGFLEVEVVLLYRDQCIDMYIALDELH